MKKEKKTSKYAFNGYQFKALFDSILLKYQQSADYSNLSQKGRINFIGTEIDQTKNPEEYNLIEAILLDKKVFPVIKKFFGNLYKESTDGDYAAAKDQLKLLQFVQSLSQYTNSSQLTPGYLYKRYGDFLENDGNIKKGKEKSLQNIKALYAEILFAYADIKKPQEFLSKYQENHSLSQLTEHNISLIPETTSATFDVYYYSYIDFTTKTFELKLTQKPEGYFIEMNSFHDNPLKNEVYKGDAEINDAKLQATLTKDEVGSKDKVYLIINSGDNPFESPEMRGAIMTVSAKVSRSIINLEIYLIDRTKVKQNKSLISIERYLFMHRYNFRIATKALSSINLKARSTKVGYLNRLVGTYRVWRLDPGFQNIVQSLLIIKNNYKVNCYNFFYQDVNLSEQACLLHQNYFNKEVLCISTHPKKGTGFVGYMMVNTTPLQKHLYGGTFLSISDEHDHNPINRIIILKKEDFSEYFMGVDQTLDLSKTEQLKKELPLIEKSSLNSVDSKFKGMKKHIIELERKGGLSDELLKY